MARIALAQMSMSGEISVNLERGQRAIAAAAADGADVVVFPELQLSPFLPSIPISMPNRASRCFMARKSAPCSGHVRCPRLSPSPDGLHVFQTDHGRIGVVVCFDRHYPESLRSCALQRADLIVVPTANVVGEPLEMFEWELRVAAFHNSVYVAMCKRVGREGRMTLCGRSLVVDPDGWVIARAGSEEALFTADVDIEFARARRRQNKYLELRRPESFAISGLVAWDPYAGVERNSDRWILTHGSRDPR